MQSRLMEGCYEKETDLCRIGGGFTVLLVSSADSKSYVLYRHEPHWASGVIDAWSNYGVIQGDKGYFRPDENITRADLAVIVSRVMGLKRTSQTEFLDLEDCTAEQKAAILKLNAAGFMNGSNGYMRPKDYITREEAACLFGRMLRLDESAGTYRKFTDMDKVSGWAIGMVRSMAVNGYISGGRTADSNQNHISHARKRSRFWTT
jgi:hypothetical protein